MKGSVTLILLPEREQKVTLRNHSARFTLSALGSGIVMSELYFVLRQNLIERAVQMLHAMTATAWHCLI